MKFVCDRCQTRYSIADDKVRGKILKVRCKSCSNVITVREAGAEAHLYAGEDAQAQADHTVMVPFPSQDTGAGVPAAPAATRGAPPPSSARATEVSWYMSLEGNQTGPFPWKVLIDKLALLPADADLHVWNESMDGWKPPEQVPALAREIQSRRKAAVPPPPGRRPTGPHAVPAPKVAPPASKVPAPVPIPAPAAVPRPTRSSRPLPGPLGSTATLPVPSGFGDAPTAAPAAAASSAPAAAAAAAPAAEPAASDPANTSSGGLRKVRKPANGTTAHAAAAAAPVHPVVGGESDALKALNIGETWQPEGSSAIIPSDPAAPAPATDVARPSTGWQSVSVSTTVGQGRHRNLKLIGGLLAIVAVIVVVITLNFGKKPVVAPAETARSTAPADKSFADLAEKLAQENKTAQNTPAPPPAVKPGGPEGFDAEKAEAAKGTSVAVVSKGAGRNRGAKPGKPSKNGGRNLPTAPPPLVVGSATQPGPVPPGTSPLARYADGSMRNIQIPSNSSSSKMGPQGDPTRVINANKGQIRSCYQRALLKDNTLTSGKITVHVSVGTSGRVKSVGIDGPQAFRTLEPCIKEVVTKWAFPPSGDSYDAEFVYVFQGSE